MSDSVQNEPSVGFRILRTSLIVIGSLAGTAAIRHCRESAASEKLNQAIEQRREIEKGEREKFDAMSNLDQEVTRFKETKSQVSKMMEATFSGASSEALGMMQPLLDQDRAKTMAGHLDAKDAPDGWFVPSEKEESIASAARDQVAGISGQEPIGGFSPDSGNAIQVERLASVYQMGGFRNAEIGAVMTVDIVNRSNGSKKSGNWMRLDQESIVIFEGEGAGRKLIAFFTQGKEELSMSDSGADWEFAEISFGMGDFTPNRYVVRKKR